MNKNKYENLDYGPFGGLKRCPKCREYKTMDNFHSSKGKHKDKSGLSAQCRSCLGVKDLEIHRFVGIPRLKSETERRWRYGKEYEKGVSGNCEICGSYLASHIDHDHITGKVRGFLCRRCNIGLGQFQDNKEFLYKAISYLEDK